MSIVVDKFELEILELEKLVKLEGDYSKRLVAGLAVKIANSNVVTRRLNAARKDEARIFAGNADLLATAVKLMKKFSDDIASGNHVDQNLDSLVGAYLGSRVKVRSLPEVGDNYKLAAMIFVLASHHAISTSKGHDTRALSVELADLEALSNKIASIFSSHTEASRWSPPAIIPLP
jgi:hypothetical protein